MTQLSAGTKMKQKYQREFEIVHIGRVRGMKSEITQKRVTFVRKGNWLEFKLESRMLLIGTPIRTFAKLPIPLVGPLPITVSGNQYVLTWEDNLSKYLGAIPLSKID